MNNRKKVWAVQLSHTLLKTYPIGTDYDNVFDYYTYRSNELELHKNPDNNDLRKVNTSMLNKLFSSSEENNGIMQPSRLWIETSLQETPSEEEYLFWGSGTVIMNENCANIFKQLNLGKNLLNPVQIFELETRKIWRDNFFYILNVCDERK